jgi:uncharacterized protein (TIGR02231 family)
LAILFLTPVLPSPVFSAEYSSRVDRVVLYPGMAEVTRVAEVDKPEGTVVLPGLTPNLLPDTLSAKIERGDARIAGTAEKRRAEAAIQAFKREKNLLERGVLSIYSGGEEGRKREIAQPPRLTAAEVEGALSLFRDRDQAIDGMVFDRERKIRELDKGIQAAKKELNKIRAPREKQEKVVRIDLEHPAQCRIAVTYLVPAAGFAPRYNVRLRPAEGTLAFELVGEAWQRTGEDWKDSVLTFSTTQPGRMAQLPPLPPWNIDFPKPSIARPMGGFYAKSELAAMDAVEEKAAERAAGAPPPERKFASFEVTLEGRHSLPGDGEKKMFPLTRQEQTTKVAWRSIPRVTDGAFLAADGRNESGLPIFAAPAGLFLEDAYAGRGRLPDIPEGEEFKIDFGKDPGVLVKRKERLRKREEGGVFAKVKRVRFRYEITAQNFRNETVPLTVLDQVPFPQHKDIVVKEVEITGGGKQEEQGEVKWELSLAKGEKKVLGLSFTVEYPADKEIHGL